MSSGPSVEKKNMNNDDAFKVTGKDVEVRYGSMEKMLEDSWCFSASELAQIRRIASGESVEVDLGDDDGVITITKLASAG